MATVSTLVDDLDGTSPATTVHFQVNGKSYAVDLNEENAQTLQDLMDQVEEKFKPFVRVARPLGTTSVKKSNKPEYDAKAVRAWAESQGMEVSSRGRIKKEILDAYYARKDR